MIARAALGKPWLFRQVLAAMRGEEIPPDPTLEEECELLVRHYDLVRSRFGAERGTLLMRKFACCYAQGRRGARDFRAAVARVCTPEEFLNAVNEYFPREFSRHEPSKRQRDQSSRHSSGGQLIRRFGCPAGLQLLDGPSDEFRRRPGVGAEFFEPAFFFVVEQRQVRAEFAG